MFKRNKDKDKSKFSIQANKSDMSMLTRKSEMVNSSSIFTQQTNAASVFGNIELKFDIDEGSSQELDREDEKNDIPTAPVCTLQSLKDTEPIIEQVSNEDEEAVPFQKPKIMSSFFYPENKL